MLRGLPGAVVTSLPSLSRTLAAALLLAAGAWGCEPAPEQEIDAIRLQQEIGSWEQSVDALRRFLERHPEHPEASLLLGTAQLRLGQPALAVWPLETAARAAPWSLQAKLALGTAWLQLEQFDAALEAADGVLAGEPGARERIEALKLRAAVQLAARDPEAALEDSEALLAVVGDDPEALLLRASALVAAERSAEAAEPLERIWTSPVLAETPVAARAGLALVDLFEDDLDDPERAARQLEAVLERFPTQRAVLDFTVRFQRRQGQPERALELLRGALERRPEDLALRSILAGELVRQERGEEGEAILVEATRLSDEPAAWLALAELYRALARTGDALTALERALDGLPGVNDYLRFKHADLLAGAGRLARAEEVAGAITEPAYRDIVMGRIAYDRGDAGAALEHLDAGLRRWPNHAVGRFLAGMAALELGRIERAREEFREASRVDPGGTDAALKLAWIQLVQGNPLAAAVAASRVVNAEDASDERVAKALLLIARAQAELGNREAVAGSIARLRELGGREAEAALAEAELAARQQGPEAAIRSIEASGLDATDPAHEPLLRTLCLHLVAAGRAPDALARVDAALARQPDAARLHDLRARVAVQAGRVDEASAGFARALEIDPALAPALAGQASLLEARGELARARERLAQARAAEPREAAWAYQAGRLELAAGDVAAAEQALGAAVRLDPFHASANNDLAWLLAERGEDLERALALAQRAVAVERSGSILDTLGWVQLRRGEAAAAVKALEAARGLEPGSPSIATRLGLALAASGETSRARAVLEEALATGEFPEAALARAELARLAEAGR